MRLRFLVENHCGEGSLLAEHGLSVLIETPRGTLLFDSGAGRALAANARALGVDLGSVDAAVLSHGHYDHAGGLAELVALRGFLPLYAHRAFRGCKIARRGGRERFIGCHLAPESVDFRPVEGVVEIVEGVWAMTTTPESRDPALVPSTPTLLLREGTQERADPMEDDLSLVIRGRFGYSVLFGCAHAGAANILAAAATTFGTRRFYAVAGGMHLVGQEVAFVDRVLQALSSYEVSLWRPCHCTGLKALCAMDRVFADVQWASAGTSLEI